MGPTAYGGAFLLLKPAVRLYRLAADCFKSLGGDKGPRLVLSLWFKAVLGVQRIFHFETLHDVGFALLTGGTTVLGRSQLGGLVRAVSFCTVKNFVRRTVTPLTRAAAVVVSLDDHAIARFTRKFDIRKGYHTIRNKHMKVEKLFMSYLVLTRTLVSLWVSPGNGRLTQFAKRVLPTLRRRARGAKLCVLCDAAAAAKTAELLELVGRHSNQLTVVRVPRRPAYRKAWAQIPSKQWQQLEEPGPYKAAPAKLIWVAQTRTELSVPRKGHRPKKVSVRTIVVREAAGRGKERWHALWIFGDEQISPYNVIQLYRQRQGHEQTYRVLVHDAHVDTAPSGYDKNSRRPQRPGFKRNALTLYAWIAALVYNALEEFTQSLPPRFLHAHPRTLRRWFWQVPGEVFLGHNALIVLLQPRRLRTLWETLVHEANRHPVKIPWLDERRLILSVEPSRPVPAAKRAERARCLDQAHQFSGRKFQPFQRRGF